MKFMARIPKCSRLSSIKSAILPYNDAFKVFSIADFIEDEKMLAGRSQKSIQFLQLSPHPQHAQPRIYLGYKKFAVRVKTRSIHFYTGAQKKTLKGIDRNVQEDQGLIFESRACAK